MIVFMFLLTAIVGQKCWNYNGTWLYKCPSGPTLNIIRCNQLCDGYAQCLFEEDEIQCPICNETQYTSNNSCFSSKIP